MQLRLYKNGVTVSEVIFNGTDSNMNSWFSPSRILSSTWSDVTPSQTYNVFNMEGHVQQLVKFLYLSLKTFSKTINKFIPKL